MDILNYYLLLQGKEKGSLVRIDDGGEFKYNNSTGKWEDSDVMENFYAEHEDNNVNVWGKIHEFRKKISEEEAMKIVATANKEIAKDKWQNREMREELDLFAKVNHHAIWDDEVEDNEIEIANAFEIEDVDVDHGYDKIDLNAIPEPVNILDELFWSSSKQRKEDYYGNHITQSPKPETTIKPWQKKEYTREALIHHEEPQPQSQHDLTVELGELKNYLETRFNPWFASIFYRNMAKELHMSLFLSTTFVDTEDLFDIVADISAESYEASAVIIKNHHDRAIEIYKKANEGNTDGFVAFTLANDGLVSVSELARHIAKTLYCDLQPCDETCHYKHVEKVVAMVNSQYEKATAWLFDIIEQTGVTAQELLTAGIPEKVVAAVLLLTKVDNVSHDVYLKAIKTNKVALAVKIALLKQNMNLAQITDITADDLDVQRQNITELEILLKD